MVKLVRKEPKTLLFFLTFTGKSEFTKSDFFLAFQNCKTKENKKKTRKQSVYYLLHLLKIFLYNNF